MNVDGPKILIVLRNLISNAIKFTPKGGDVTLNLIPVNLLSGSGALTQDGTSSKIAAAPPQDTTHFRLVLSDTGRGLSVAEQKQLFTKIVQFSPNEAQNGGGSGIGLFLSHEIMASHGLKVQVCSAGVPGKGTEFFIDFPRLQASNGTCRKSANAPQSKITTASKMLACWTSLASCGAKRQRKTSLPVHVEPRSSARIFSEQESKLGPTPPVPSSSQSYISEASFENIERGTFGGGSLPRLVTQPSVGQLSRRYVDASKTLSELSVLLVDDSSLNMKMISRTLKKNRVGKTFRCLSDGLDLLSEFGATDEDLQLAYCDRGVGDGAVLPQYHLKNETTYDVILLDDHMNRMNGSEAVKILRWCGYNGLIIGLSGCALQEDLAVFCEAGVDYALPKPFVVDDFIRILNMYF